MKELRPELEWSDLWLSDDHDLQAQAWKEATGAEWRERNPTDAEGTDVSWMTRFGVKKTAVIREAMWGIPHDTSWLEVGCSGGAHMRCYEAVGYKRTLGCDMNLEALATADRRAQADARYLPFATGSVDGITTSGSLMHFGPHERMTDCITEMARVARRWLCFYELWHETPMMLHFGDLLPPAWIVPWEGYFATVLGPEWALVRRRMYDVRATNFTGPMSVFLLQRVGDG